MHLHLSYRHPTARENPSLRYSEVFRAIYPLSATTAYNGSSQQLHAKGETHIEAHP
jgi:hypothetical protein